MFIRKGPPSYRLFRDEHIGALEQRFLLVRELAEALLPFGRLADPRRLYGGDLVLGAIGRPVRVFGRDHIGAGLGEVEGRVDDPRLHPLGYARPQHSIARAARYTYPISLVDAALLCI